MPADLYRQTLRRRDDRSGLLNYVRAEDGVVVVAHESATPIDTTGKTTPHGGLRKP
jgi:hypothetical protein